MLKVLFSTLARRVFAIVCISFSVASASGQVTRLDRQLQRLDFAVSGTASITKGVAGSNYLGTAVTQNASTTLGALVQIRYTKSPLLGAEFNYSYARFTENYSASAAGAGNFPGSPFGVQTNASEYTVGYVAHLPTLLGVQPFASVGAGSFAFTPTPGGGQGLPERARATYYYSVGVDDQFSRYFGVRAQFRQLFYKAPDFGTNYLTIQQQTITSEPSIGVYIKF